MRRSTPDSEALASSDEDHDGNGMSQSMHSVHSTQSSAVPKPARRSSWLSEVQSGTQQRKFSLGSLPGAAIGSQPSTPGAESTTVAWGPITTSSGPRRQVVAPSLDSNHSYASMASMSDDDAAVLSPINFDGPKDDKGFFPFPIPMQPRKAYRSQSYSVGQLDNEVDPSLGPQVGITGNHQIPGGRSAIQGLSHRPARPSMLGENSGRTALGLVLEDDDDDMDGNNDPRAPPGIARMPAKADSAQSLMGSNSGLLKQASNAHALSKQRTSSNAGLYSAAEAYPNYSFATRQIDPTAEEAMESE